MPPSTSSVVPVMDSDASLAENTAAAATSHAFWADVESQHFSEHDDGGLGHRVEACFLFAPAARIGCYVDHAAVAPCEVRIAVLCVQQVAAHVDAHDAVIVDERRVDQPGAD